MLYVVVLIAVLALIALFPVLRCAATHPISLTVYGVRDAYYYIVRKQANSLGAGELVAYTGLFGKGKTLSAVHHVVSAYHAYNGKLVWCPRRKRIVRQRVHVISNVALSIPYEDFKNLSQIVTAAEHQREYDDENDCLTVTLVLGDEFSVQMNSRNFKSNIDPLFLNTILTCRHYYISLYYTAQRFGHVDALLRQVTSSVIDCDKLWRFQRLNYYDAWDMEHAANPQLLAPYRRDCWFVKDSDFEAYDTLACVGNLNKSMQAGDMLTEEEILKLQQNTEESNMESVQRPSRRWFRRQKQTRK